MRSPREHVEEDEKRAEGGTLGIATLRCAEEEGPQRILKRSLGTTEMVEGGPGRAFIRRMGPGHLGLVQGMRITGTGIHIHF